jgi:hypothetical protein
MCFTRSQLLVRWYENQCDGSINLCLLGLQPVFMAVSMDWRYVEFSIGNLQQTLYMQT